MNAAPRAPTLAETVPASGASPGRGRDHWREWMQRHPVHGVPPDEVEAHFASMPERYWEKVRQGELVWGLETMHRFLERFVTSDAGAASVSADWRRASEEGHAKVMVCAWDRHGLLAKIAAAFSALRVNILRADAYTRTDHLVLDVFEVREMEARAAASGARLQHVAFLVEGALSDPPRFASLWACQRHRILGHPAARVPPRLRFDNRRSPQHTVLNVEAPDRLGLLHDVLQALADCGLNVTQAAIDTDDDVAHDLFCFTNLRGEKVRELKPLRQIQRAVVEAIGA